MIKPIEQEFIVRDTRIACQLWREEQPIKVLALHGWLDNSASFETLAALLPGCCVVAPDLAGQGLSQHRPTSATYHLWDDILDIAVLVKQLGWDEFIIIGHSRGAMLASMFAASFPEQVKQLVLLDAIMPWPVKADQAAKQLRAFVDDYQKEKPKHYFARREEALRVRAKASGFEIALAEVLAQRQLQQAEEGWYWRIDERLKAASAIKLLEEHNQAFLSSIQCPVHIFMSTEGLGRLSSIKALEAQFPQFNWCTIQGHHHAHMTSAAEEIAQLCYDLFLS